MKKNSRFASSPSTWIPTAALALGVAFIGYASPAAAQPVSPPAAAGTAAAGRHGARALTAAQTAGVVTRYVVGPMGHVRGFVLNNGAIVLVHARGGDTLAQQVAVGQSVRVQGFAAPGNAQVIRRATVYGANGAVLAAPAAMGTNGAQGHGGRRGQWQNADPATRAAMMQSRRQARQARLAQLSPRTASGTVQTVVAGPRGNARMLLLSDGSTVVIPRPMTRALGAQQRPLRAGESVRVSGRGTAGAHGASVIAEQLTRADGTTVSAALGAPPAAAPRR